MDIRTALTVAIGQGIERADAEILLSAALSCSRAHLIAYHEQILNNTQQTQYSSFCEARIRGVPIAYLLREREFYGLAFHVNENVLIPRHETELLVELALHKLLDLTNPRVLDLGTGSGVIACAIAANRPDADVIAVDQSASALAIAQSNAKRHALSNISFALGSWFEPIQHVPRFDVVVCNPPYLAADDAHLQQGDLRFEPLDALRPMHDGNALADLAHVIAHAPRALKMGGWLMLEHGATQGEAVRRQLTLAGYRQVSTMRDYSELERVSVGQI